MTEEQAKQSRRQKESKEEKSKTKRKSIKNTQRADIDKTKKRTFRAKREALTFVFSADHAVTFESAQVAVAAQAEIVLGPLKHAGFIEDSTGHNDRFTDDGCLIFRFTFESLH